MEEESDADDILRQRAPDSL